jgi:hypothetical protein
LEILFLFFLFDPILFYSNLKHFLLVLVVETLDLNKSSRLRGPDSRTVLDPKTLTLAFDANVIENLTVGA